MRGICPCRESSPEQSDQRAVTLTAIPSRRLATYVFTIIMTHYWNTLSGHTIGVLVFMATASEPALSLEILQIQYLVQYYSLVSPFSFTKGE